MFVTPATVGCPGSGRRGLRARAARTREGRLRADVDLEPPEVARGSWRIGGSPSSARAWYHSAQAVSSESARSEALDDFTALPATVGGMLGPIERRAGVMERGETRRRRRASDPMSSGTRCEKPGDSRLEASRATGFHSPRASSSIGFSSSSAGTGLCSQPGCSRAPSRARAALRSRRAALPSAPSPRGDRVPRIRRRPCLRRLRSHGRCLGRSDSRAPEACRLFCECRHERGVRNERKARSIPTASAERLETKSCQTSPPVHTRCCPVCPQQKCSFAGRFDSCRAHRKPDGSTETAWLRRSYMPNVPRNAPCACVPRCVPRISQPHPKWVSTYPASLPVLRSTRDGDIAHPHVRIGDV